MTLPSNETLMAFADGELPPAEAAQIESLIAADGNLREKVETFRLTRELAKNALKPLAQEPVPPALEASVLGLIAANATKDAEGAADNVVQFRSKPEKQATPRHWSTRIAASVAVLAAAFGGYGLGMNASSTSPASVATVGAPVTGAVARLLSHEESGSEQTVDGSRVKLVSSIRAQDGTLCREFEIDTLASKQTNLGIACRRGDTWHLDIAVSAPASEDGYAPASSSNALEGYLEAIGASEVLDPEQERNALR